MATKTRRESTRLDRNQPSPAPERPSDERIRERAYEIYLSRNGEPANPLVDWLEAEHELRQESAPNRGQDTTRQAHKNRPQKDRSE